jgi:hypothetical protein
MEQETEQKERECPACLGTGELTVQTEGQSGVELRVCPVCEGEEVIPCTRPLFLVWNPTEERLNAFLAEFEGGAKAVTVRYPDDYAIHAVVEADSLEMACRVAAARGVCLMNLTVIERPDGALFAQPLAHELLEH